MLTDLLCRQIRDISFSFFYQLYGTLIHLIEIIGRKEKSAFPVRAKPLDVLRDRLHELGLLLGRICIVKSQIKLSAIFLCQTIIQKNGLRMTDMQIAIRFRWKSGMNNLAVPFLDVLVNHLLNKIL